MIVHEVTAGDTQDPLALSFTRNGVALTVSPQTVTIKFSASLSRSMEKTSASDWYYNFATADYASLPAGTHDFDAVLVWPSGKQKTIKGLQLVVKPAI